MAEKLTPKTFDRMVGEQSPRPESVIWTLPAIARRLGVGVDFVRDTLAAVPGTPVRKIGGRWYALETELAEFMRGR
jgi:hypothetical protein